MSLVTVLKWIETTREKTGNLSDVATLQKTFDRMK
jgi:hypothetical protein